MWQLHGSSAKMVLAVCVQAMNLADILWGVGLQWDFNATVARLQLHTLSLLFQFRFLYNNIAEWLDFTNLCMVAEINLYAHFQPWAHVAVLYKV